MTCQRPLPTQTPETKPLWVGVYAERLIVLQCAACRKFQFPYRGFCCHCWTTELDEVEAAQGTVFTHSTILRNDTEGFEPYVPYVVAMVQLSADRGGLMVQTNIVGCDPESVHIGMPVEVTFIDTVEGQKLPMFTPRRQHG
jgi:uncharacterized OB-fold protein